MRPHAALAMDRLDTMIMYKRARVEEPAGSSAQESCETDETVAEASHDVSDIVKHGSSMVHGLGALWRAQQLCDFTLVTSDGGRREVHSVEF